MLEHRGRVGSVPIVVEVVVVPVPATIGVPIEVATKALFYKTI